MPRPSQLDQKRRELLPIVARAFAELGYRRATTAELAARCGVQENILYRLWPGKKAMFIAAIGAVYDVSVDMWRRVLAGPGGGRSAAQRLLAHEAENFGRFGHHRIVFAGLNETDDRDIRAALAEMYQRYHRFVCDHVLAHRAQAGRAARSATSARAEASALAWALIGLGTVTSITRELGLLDDAARRRLMSRTGEMLLDGRT
ncbi:MAG: TetR/AcrR family transcriptional regulator [Phycisphaerales bacterium]